MARRLVLLLAPAALGLAARAKAPLAVEGRGLVLRGVGGEAARALRELREWIQLERRGGGELPAEARDAILAALSVVARGRAGTTAVVAEAVGMVGSWVDGARSLQPPDGARALAALCESPDIGAAEVAAMLDIVARLVPRLRLLADVASFELLARVLRRVAERSQCASDAAATLSRVIVVGGILRSEAPKEITDVSDVVRALSAAACCPRMPDKALRSAVAVLKCVAQDRQQLRWVGAPAVQAALVRLAEHPAATIGTLREIRGAVSTTHAREWLGVLRSIMWRLTQGAPAGVGSGDELAAEVADCFVLAKHIARREDAFGTTSARPASADIDFGCPAVLAFFTDTPMLSVGGEALSRPLPTAVEELVGRLVPWDKLEARTDVACEEAVEACVEDALSGDLETARALWLAACMPTGAVAAVAVEGFVSSTRVLGTGAVGRAVSAEDVVRVASCLRPLADDDAASVSHDPMAAEVRRMQAVMSGLEALLGSWPVAERRSASAGVRQLCSAAERVSEGAGEGSAAGGATLADLHIRVCGRPKQEEAPSPQAPHAAAATEASGQSGVAEEPVFVAAAAGRGAAGPPEAIVGPRRRLAATPASSAGNLRPGRRRGPSAIAPPFSVHGPQRML